MECHGIEGGAVLTKLPDRYRGVRQWMKFIILDPLGMSIRVSMGAPVGDSSERRMMSIHPNANPCRAANQIGGTRTRSRYRPVCCSGASSERRTNSLHPRQIPRQAANIKWRHSYEMPPPVMAL